jgi:hypothetical protein
MGKARGQLSDAFSLGLLANGYTNRAAGRSAGEPGPENDLAKDRAQNYSATATWLATRMATKASIEAAVQRLLAQQVTEIAAVPLLLSFGGIEAGIRKRLNGLDYTMSDQALLPDPRIARWIVESARSTMRVTKGASS